MVSQQQCAAGSGATCVSPITTTYAYATLTETGKEGFARTTVTETGEDGLARTTGADLKRHQTVFETNLAGQRTHMEDPAAGASDYAYDGNGQTTKVSSAAGIISMTYDDLGRMTDRTSTVAATGAASSEAHWHYVADPTSVDFGLLHSVDAATVTPSGKLTATSTTEYDKYHRPVSTTLKLPASPTGTTLMGDLSGLSYTTKVASYDAQGHEVSGYDSLGQVTDTAMPAAGGLPAEVAHTEYWLSGQAKKLTLTGGGLSTPVVTGVAVSGTGQLLSREYGNLVSRDVSWNTVTRSISQLSASFGVTQSGSTSTVTVQSDAFTRDVMGRLTQVASVVTDPVTGVATSGVSAQCFAYDGHNRLASAWTMTGTTGASSCGTAAPAAVGATGWDASATAYATKWEYSLTGQITKIINGAGTSGVAATLTYGQGGAPASAVTTMSEGTASNSYAYDGAGRQTTRAIDGKKTTTLSWDVNSSLVQSAEDGGTVEVYAYDASGNRVAKITTGQNGLGGSVTGYLGSTELTDADTSVNADLTAHPNALAGTDYITGTRYYTFGGASVAVRQVSGGGTGTGVTVTPTPTPTPTPSPTPSPAPSPTPPPAASGPLVSKLWLTFGDQQGSATAMMPVTLDASGGMLPATAKDAADSVRNAYTPYGAVRGTDQLPTDRGWLNQVSDEASTGLVYLNARYYDPGASRFVSPDPLMNPGDPKTLDPYRYADNNPVVFTDATGLLAIGQYDYADVPVAQPQVKPFTAKFAKGVVKAVWKTAATDALNMTLFGTVKSATLLVTDPKAFVGQYGQAWNTAKNVGSAWRAGVGSAVSVLKGDKSLGDHFSQILHSSIAGHFGNSWDAKDPDAVGSTWTHGLEIVGAAVGLKGGFAPTEETVASVTTADRVTAPLWTPKNGSTAANALSHFNDHGSDFPGVNNALEYVADAQEFLRSPSAGTLTKVRPNGDIVRYDPSSNIFGVMDSAGAPRTYFKPDPAQHGLPTNLDYFNAQ
jgi:RHS repeat-associated protein